MASCITYFWPPPQCFIACDFPVFWQFFYNIEIPSSNNLLVKWQQLQLTRAYLLPCRLVKDSWRSVQYGHHHQLVIEFPHLRSSMKPLKIWQNALNPSEIQRRWRYDEEPFLQDLQWGSWTRLKFISWGLFSFNDQINGNIFGNVLVSRVETKQ